MITQCQPNDTRPLANLLSYTKTQHLVNKINSLLLKLDTTLQCERKFLATLAARKNTDNVLDNAIR